MSDTVLKVHAAERLNSGLVRLDFNGLRDLWSRATLRGRTRPCWRCGRDLCVAEDVFRPLGNHGHRMRRICWDCMGEIAPLHPGLAKG